MDGLDQMSELFHYTHCGLDYVYLLNGYTIHHHPQHGPGVSIKNAHGLHNAIAKLIVSSPSPLRGQEVRFLRAELKASQEGLARILGQKRGSVARWEGEPDKAIPGVADRALRFFYALRANGVELGRKIVELVTEIDDLEHPQSVLRLEETERGWRRKAA
jgi:DNA-binding transcriptional regulator YiaG